MTLDGFLDVISGLSFSRCDSCSLEALSLYIL